MLDYITFIIAILILINYLFLCFFTMYVAKKCGYDCFKCNMFDCPGQYCDRKRKELKK